MKQAIEVRSYVRKMTDTAKNPEVFQVTAKFPHQMVRLERATITGRRVFAGIVPEAVLRRVA